MKIAGKIKKGHAWLLADVYKRQVMVLSSSISALAGEEIFVDIPEASEEFSSEPMVVTETESAGEDVYKRQVLQFLQ